MSLGRSAEDGYQDMDDYIKSIYNLKNHGFDVTGIFPGNRDQWLRVVEFDLIAINRKIIN